MLIHFISDVFQLSSLPSLTKMYRGLIIFLLIAGFVAAEAGLRRSDLYKRLFLSKCLNPSINLGTKGLFIWRSVVEVPSIPSHSLPLRLS